MSNDRINQLRVARGFIMTAWFVWLLALVLPSYVTEGFGGPDGITIVCASGFRCWIMLLNPLGFLFIILPWWLGWFGNIVMYRTLSLVIRPHTPNRDWSVDRLSKIFSVGSVVLVGCVFLTLAVAQSKYSGWSFFTGVTTEHRYLSKFRGNEFFGPLVGAIVWWIAIVFATIGICLTPTRVRTFPPILLSISGGLPAEFPNRGVFADRSVESDEQAGPA